MRISSISLVADEDERYACKKDSDGWVWVYIGDISLLVKPQHVEHLVHLRDALNEILEGVPLPDEEVVADELEPQAITCRWCGSHEHVSSTCPDEIPF